MNETKTKATETQARRRILVGRVVSLSGDKTIRIDTDRLVKHPRYGKFVKKRTRLMAHDPDGLAQAGDLVEVTPCRPLSKHKAHRLIRVVRKNPADAGLSTERKST